jgi:predicted CDP-diglyceride synthetase/phosphatidate cytidylyltransferase
MVPRSLILIGIVLALLGAATFAGQMLRRRASPALDQRAIDAFNGRIQAWWFFTVVIILAFVLPGLTVLMFALVSFWALR